MRRILIATAAAFTLGACVPTLGNIPSTPRSVADQSVLDERAAIAVEASYKAFRTVLESLVDAGMITGETATRAAELDNRAYAAVQAVRAAYRTGNAESYAAAVNEARQAIAAGLGAIKGNG